MGLFFDNKQHLSGMKKIYLLEKRVDRLESEFESTTLKSHSQGNLQNTKDEILSELLEFIEKQNLLPNMEVFREEILEKVQTLLDSRAFEQNNSLDVNKLREELLEQVSKIKNPENNLPQKNENSQKKIELLENPKAEEPLHSKLTAKIDQMEKSIQAFQNIAPSPEQISEKIQATIKEELQNTQDGGVLNASKMRKPSLAMLDLTSEETYQQLKGQVQKILSTSKIPQPKPQVDPSVVENIVEEMLEQQIFPQIQSLIEKQGKKIKKLERKIRKLTVMLSSMDMDDDDDDDDDFMEIFSSRRRKKRSTKKKPLRRPQKKEVVTNLAPAQNAALEGLFNLNMELQES